MGRETPLLFRRGGVARAGLVENAGGFALGGKVGVAGFHAVIGEAAADLVEVVVTLTQGVLERGKRVHVDPGV